MADATQQIADNVNTGSDVNSMNVDQETVQVIEQRIQQQMPDIASMGKFEQLLQQSMPLAQALVKLCPELLVAFVNVAQDMQNNGGAGAGGDEDDSDDQGQSSGSSPGMQALLSGNGGLTPPGGNDGATPPMSQPDASNAPPLPSQGGSPAMGGGGMPAPAATATGNAPPSIPNPSSPLRNQFYTGR